MNINNKYDGCISKGNAAVLKCNIPSFVSDHVEIIEWVDTNGGIYTRDDSNSGKEKKNKFVVYNYTIVYCSLFIGYFCVCLYNGTEMVCTFANGGLYISLLHTPCRMRFFFIKREIAHFSEYLKFFSQTAAKKTTRKNWERIVGASLASLMMAISSSKQNPFYSIAKTHL